MSNLLGNAVAYNISVEGFREGHGLGSSFIAELLPVIRLFLWIMVIVLIIGFLQLMASLLIRTVPWCLCIGRFSVLPLLLRQFQEAPAPSKTGKNDTGK